MTGSTIAELKKRLAELEFVAKKGILNTERVDVLNELATLYLFAQPVKTHNYSLKALRLAEKMDYKQGVAVSYRLLGASYVERGELDKGLKCSFKALEICEGIGEKRIMGHCFSDIGLVYKSKGKYSKALEYQKRTLQLAKELGWNKGIANTYLNIGLIHKQRGDFDTALAYYFKSLKENERIENLRGIASANLNIGLIYRHQDDLKHALQYQMKALEVFTKIGDNRGIANCHGNIGLIHMHGEDFDKALYHHQKAKTAYEELGNQIGLATTDANIGITYTRIGDHHKALEYQLNALKRSEEIGYNDGIVSSLVNIGVSYGELDEKDTALNYFEKGLKLALKIGAQKWEMLAYMNISLVWEQLNNPAKALLFYKKYSELRHNIYSEESSAKIAQMRVRYETDRKEAEAEIYRLKTVELEKLVEQRTSELLRSAKLATIGVFAGGIAHQINNPLAIMSSTLTVIAKKLEANPDICGELHSDLNGNLDILHAQIQRAHKTVSGLLAFARDKDTTIQPANINLLINDVLQFLLQRHKAEYLSLNLNLDKKLPKALVDSEALRQVLTNVIQNSIEAMDGKGKLTIVTKLKPSNIIGIDISDTGPGIPSDVREKIFDPLFTTKSKGTGLGLSLAAVLLERFNGKIRLVESLQAESLQAESLQVESLQTEFPHGARFVIEVPGCNTEEK